MKVFGITGWKNSGKTTLVADLVTRFRQRGLSVSTVKHAHHNFDIDKPGTDSYKHRQAGAKEVLISSANRWALMHETVGDREPELEALLARLSPVDLVLVEGFKRSDHPKLQVIRAGNNTEPLPASAQPLVAIVSDGDLNPSDYNCKGPLLPLEDTQKIADFILAYSGLEKEVV
ncbi:molybdopterin-guanine dinucleotide biosynthesis protein B [Exilibacterium tricleocarpae]|uniref:Molybdopterin-guanine dinucleotide biosynthesis protein B n=1 Tax=Exilibacterium tricleocarpae TaxID=2591008 RepID=A0A545U5F3_9GAMM|nr:molybdopterin-guanine dinucleotide biosynthesis protein B [Exilibacterium tricleocarpae]TQV84700.1 molybdopterin-guanine dinucleotide biosynthesis protein B [Exilibacterium tricleocarpae]